MAEQVFRPATSMSGYVKAAAKSSLDEPGLDAFLPTRAMPTPISEDYSAYLRVVMKTRIQRLWVLSGSIIAVPLIASAVFSASFRILNIIAATAIACMSPVFIRFIRQHYLKVSYPSYPTRLSRLSSTLNYPAHAGHLLFYSLSSLHIMFAYIIFQAWPELYPITVLPGRDTWQVGEGFAYILWSTCLTATAFTSLHVWESRDVLTISHAQTPIAQRVFNRISQRMSTAIPVSVAVQFISLLLYISCRNTILHFVLDSTPIGPFIRPHLYIFFRRRYLSIGFFNIFSCTFLVNIFVSFVLELLNCLCDVYFSQPVIVSNFSNNPNKCLLNGLQSTNDYVQMFAYYELAYIAAQQHDRRVAIFKEIRSSPPTISQIFRQCLKTVDGSNQRVLPESQMLIPQQQPSIISKKSETTQESSKSQSTTESIPMMSAEKVFKQSSESTFEKFLSTFFAKPLFSSATTPAAATSSALKKGPSLTKETPLPSIFHVSQPSTPENDASTTSSSTSNSTEKTKFLKPDTAFQGSSRLLLLVPLQIRQTRLFRLWTKPLLSEKIFTLLPTPDCDICSIQALSFLIVFSLNEDSFGLTQREIPKTLESMTQYLSTLDSLVVRLRTLDKQSGNIPDDDDVRDNIEQHVQPIIDALKDGTLHILKTFEPYLKDLEFSPRTAKRLQEIFDYSADVSSREKNPNL